MFIHVQELLLSPRSGEYALKGNFAKSSSDWILSTDNRITLTTAVVYIYMYIYIYIYVYIYCKYKEHNNVYEIKYCTNTAYIFKRRLRPTYCKRQIVFVIRLLRYQSISNLHSGPRRYFCIAVVLVSWTRYIIRPWMHSRSWPSEVVRVDR